ncbi:MAG: metallophosphoesterase [Methanomicrobiales archaeon]|nr:metallophosphoesterase [Methanomicrobiales archaeon]NYT21687.1 metallophosphoesterase [Methanomicrobiales archaeon]
MWDGSQCSVTHLGIDGSPGEIVFISDPHLRPENIARAREVIAEINRLDPSVVIIGGDFGFDRGDDPALQDVWQEIDAPVYAVLGNHDYLTGIDGSGIEGRVSWILETVLRADGHDTSRFYSTPDIGYADAMEATLERNGVTVLRNEAVELTLNGTRTIIVGVDDLWAGQADPPDVRDTDAFVIYVVHEPYVGNGWNADLVLAGHTHGGQFSNPVFTACEAFDIVDISGRSDKEGVTCYVSRGIGTSAFRDEIRVFVSPEIVLLTPSP